jgi:hypothetical protein
MRDREAHRQDVLVSACICHYHREQLQLIVSTTNQRAVKMRLRAGLTGCVPRSRQS